MSFRIALLFATLAASGTLAAQTPATPAPTNVAVRIRVVDSTRAPIGGADVSIVKGLQDVLARATTDNAGRASLDIPSGTGDIQVSVRKIGYQPMDRFVVVGATSPPAADIVLRRAVQSLAPVTVTARQDIKEKSYHVDADAIASSTRPLFDAMDIVTKLMPDVMLGRAGPGMDCGVQDIWVNGIRILFPPPNDMVTSRVGTAPPAPRPPRPVFSGPGGSGRRLPLTPAQQVNSVVWLTLASIKPEHIEEVTYEDCFSTKVTDRTHANRALFVVLKNGVAYDEGRGSYVISNESPRTPRPGVPAYRARLLGVFDLDSGDPLADALVADSASGTSMRTTGTGTITLMFLPEGASVLRIKKPGYVDLRLEVLISPRDSLPITLVMGRAK